MVGIDYYESIVSLHGAANDAHNVKGVLDRHADGTTNFTQPKLLVATSEDSAVSRTELRESVQELFRDKADIALFAAHTNADVVVRGTSGMLAAALGLRGGPGGEQRGQRFAGAAQRGTAAALQQLADHQPLR